MLRRKFHAVSQPFLVAAVTLIFLPGSSLFAQVAPTLDPSRIDQNLKPAPQPKSVPRKELSLNNKQLAPKDAAALAFTFKELIFEGNVALTSKQLAALWPHKAGDTVTIEDVFALANAITKLYTDAGYALCFGVVPEQDIKDGKVKIVVVEGFVSDHSFGVAQPRARALNAVRAQVRRIKLSLPLRAATLERNILLMDDLPGWSVGSVFSASSTVVGGSDLSLEFIREPDTFDISWNNFLPSALDRQVVGASWSGFGHVDGADELSFGYYLSPNSNAYRSFNASASTLIGANGERVGITFSQSDSRPTDPLLVPLEYKGQSRSTRLTFSKSLTRSRSSTLLAEAYLGAQDSQSSMMSGTPTRDAIRTIGASLTYDFARPDQSSNLVRLNLEQGLDWLGAQGNSRANGSTTFTVAILDFTRTAPITTLGSGALSYSFAAQGQYSFGNPLLSPVESSFGGRQFGRFFDSGSMSGEHSLFGSFELRYALPMSLGFAEPVRSQFYIFTDAGFTRQQGNLQPQEARGRHAASAGLGVRLSMPHGMNALLEVARPVSIPAGSTGDTSNRLNASFGMRF
jgi:hemolysin activation/secretion protein